MNLFENHISLRGFLCRDAAVPSLEGLSESDFAVLTVCLDCGAWWRPANEWISRTAWFRVICPGLYFCGFTLGMKQGDYIEVEGKIVIHHDASMNHANPFYKIHATQIRRMEISFRWCHGKLRRMISLPIFRGGASQCLSAISLL